MRRSALLQSRTCYRELDGHKASIAVAYVATEDEAAVTYRGTIGTHQCDIDTLLCTLQSKSQHLIFCLRSGTLWAWLYRDLTKTGDVCWVVAASLIPQKAGERVETNRRDAIQLARLMRSGDLTPSIPPPSRRQPFVI